MEIINLGTKFLGSKKEEKKYWEALDNQARFLKTVSDYKLGVK